MPLRIVSCATTVLTAATVSLCLLGDIAQAQTHNPRYVSFAPSNDQDAVTSTGQPAVSTYRLSIYQAGTTQPIITLDLGKPSPQPDGYILANVADLLAGPLSPGTVLEARVAAIGPGGSGISTLSNTFLYSACQPTVSPMTVTVPAGGGSTSVAVTAGSGCAWQSESPEGWLLIVSGSTGTANGSVVLSASANTSTAARTAVVSVAGQNVIVSQDGGAGSSTPPTANVAPQVQLTRPTQGATYVAPAAITLEAAASDSDGTVARVDFYANGSLVGSASSSPYAYSWGGVRAGTYTITARATDNAGKQTTSAAVSVRVGKKRPR